MGITPSAIIIHAVADPCAAPYTINKKKIHPAIGPIGVLTMRYAGGS
jgi:hypothetical protein